MSALAWHNDAALKERTVAALRKDREIDAFVQGTYISKDPEAALGFRGCAIGCVVQSQRGIIASDTENWHQMVEDDLGIPLVVSHLIDRIFEDLSTDDEQHAQFAVDAIDAVPVGADLSLVSARFMIDILGDDEHGVLQFAGDREDVTASINQVIALYERRLDGDEPSESEWDAAAHAADAARAAARAAHCAAHWTWMSERLIHHLANAPVVAEVSA